MKFFDCFRWNFWYHCTFRCTKYASLQWFNDRINLVVHQSDYVVGCLTGCYEFSDYSNALKTGYDLIEKEWPGFIDKGLGVSLKILPKVLSPGTEIAYISRTAAELTGLSEKTIVVAGATDGYTSAIASGAVESGDFICGT
ncbi:FGGY family carbohydrate kinase [Geosporobacter subterraneus]|nr:FGGY family carbohydrate kinase [Geosporobacter subterraneus]